MSNRETGFNVRRRTPPAAYRRAAKADLTRLFDLTPQGLSRSEVVEENNILAAGVAHSLSLWRRVDTGFVARLYDFHAVACPANHHPDSQGHKAGEWTLLVYDYETRGRILIHAGYKSDIEAKIAGYLIATDLWLDADPEPAEAM